MRLLLIGMLVASMMSYIPQAFADSSCMAIYGGGQGCISSNISIEKDVVNPATNSDVHDMGVNDPAFSPGQTVTFHITVRNTSTTTVPNATVVDTFPQYLTFLNGPGNFDTNTKALTFQVANLTPNAAQTFTVRGTIVDISQLPPRGTTCPINQVTVAGPNNEAAKDSSQFCIQSTTAAIATPIPSLAAPQIASTPATGSSSILVSLLLPLGFGGFLIGKLATLKKGAKE